jgi:polyphosphate kinase
MCSAYRPNRVSTRDIGSRTRRYDSMVRLEFTHACPDTLCTLFTMQLRVSPDQAHMGRCPLGLDDDIELARLRDRDMISRAVPHAMGNSAFPLVK